MLAYLDTSVVVSLFRADAHSPRAFAFVRRERPVLLVSDLAAAEFVATVGRCVRTQEMSRPEAFDTLTRFDRWIGRDVGRVETLSADIDRAAGWIRQFDLTLRAPDAIHLAAAARLAAPVATFDRGMAAAARALSIPVAAP